MEMNAGAEGSWSCARVAFTQGKGRGARESVSRMGRRAAHAARTPRHRGEKTETDPPPPGRTLKSIWVPLGSSTMTCPLSVPMTGHDTESGSSAALFLQMAAAHVQHLRSAGRSRSSRRAVARGCFSAWCARPRAPGEMETTGRGAHAHVCWTRGLSLSPFANSSLAAGSSNIRNSMLCALSCTPASRSSRRRSTRAAPAASGGWRRGWGGGRERGRAGRRCQRRRGERKRESGG